MKRLDLTPEQMAERVRAQRRAQQQRHQARMTPEQREARRVYQREYRRRERGTEGRKPAMTPEQRLKHRAANERRRNAAIPPEVLRAKRAKWRAARKARLAEAAKPVRISKPLPAPVAVAKAVLREVAALRPRTEAEKPRNIVQPTRLVAARHMVGPEAESVAQFIARGGRIQHLPAPTFQPHLTVPAFPGTR